MRLLIWFTIGALAGYTAGVSLPFGVDARMQLALEQAQREQARLESVTRMDQHAHDRLQAALAKAEMQRAELARRLAVFERVLQPFRADYAAVVEDVAVYDTQRIGELRYRVVLSQGFQRQAQASGVVRLAVRGLVQGVPREADVVTREYRFQYLHVLEGSMQLPAGLRPQELRISLVPSATGRAQVRSYAWAAVHAREDGGRDLG